MNNKSKNADFLQNGSLLKRMRDDGLRYSKKEEPIKRGKKKSKKKGGRKTSKPKKETKSKVVEPPQSPMEAAIKKLKNKYPKKK